MVKRNDTLCEASIVGKKQNSEFFWDGSLFEICSVVLFFAVEKKLKKLKRPKWQQWWILWVCFSYFLSRRCFHVVNMPCHSREKVGPFHYIKQTAKKKFTAQFPRSGIWTIWPSRFGWFYGGNRSLTCIVCVWQHAHRVESCSNRNPFRRYQYRDRT